MKITPLIYVEEIEKSLPFWVDRLGFKKTVEVPEGNKLGFVMLTKDDAELMVQTRLSVMKDVPAFVEFARPTACLYIDVSDFADLLKRLAEVEVVLPVRETFYGMREVGVREPGGNIVCFAARK